MEAKHALELADAANKQLSAIGDLIATCHEGVGIKFDLLNERIRALEIRLDERDALAYLVKQSEEVHEQMVRLQANLPKALEAAYKKGKKQGVTDYAVWRDGKQFVGVMARPLHHVLDDINKEPFDPRGLMIDETA